MPGRICKYCVICTERKCAGKIEWWTIPYGDCLLIWSVGIFCLLQHIHTTQDWEEYRELDWYNGKKIIPDACSGFRPVWTFLFNLLGPINLCPIHSLYLSRFRSHAACTSHYFITPTPTVLPLQKNVSTVQITFEMKIKLHHYQKQNKESLSKNTQYILHTNFKIDNKSNIIVIILVLLKLPWILHNYHHSFGMLERYTNLQF